MYNKKYQFQKFVGDLFLNRLGVAKYTSIDGDKIMLKLEKVGTNRVLRTRYFDNQEEFELFLDTVTDEDDRYYNKARFVNDVINAL